MSEPLPQDLSDLDTREIESDLDTREIETVRDEQDRRLTPLFRRWPAWSARERAELRRVYTERLRIARFLGKRRRAQTG